MGGTIGFVGLGAMGLPMAVNFTKAGYRVFGFDVDSDQMAAARDHDIVPALSATEAAQNADVLITMLPSNSDVRQVFLACDGL